MEFCNKKNISPFVKVTNIDNLIPILEQRLPKSCYIFNAAKMHSRFPEQISFYTMGTEIDDTSWIVSTHYREDYGTDYSISVVEKKSKIKKEEAQEILSQCPLFDWDSPYFFVAVDNFISDIVLHVAIHVKGNITGVHPCKLFYMPREDCLELDIRVPDEDVVVKRLDPVQGVKFILDTWKYAKEGSDQVVQRLVERNESGGVYYQGKPVCGVISHGFGLLSALHTLKQFRQKGYAKLCMRFVFKELAIKGGMIPALAVEARNTDSLIFHEKLGCKVAGDVFGIFYTRPDF